MAQPTTPTTTHKPEEHAARPPMPEKRPHMVPFGAVPGQNRGSNPMSPILYIEDPYFYLRDDSRKNEQVLAHLRAENEYTKAKTAHLASVQETLYNELLSHVQETDEEVPYPHGPYLYYTRTQAGSSYKFHCRKLKMSECGGPASDAEEELLLDDNEVARGHDHCVVSGVTPSPDHRYLAYMVDYTGYGTYTGFIRNVATGKLLPDRLEHISSMEWGKDSTEIFFGTQDQAHRQDKVWRHVINSSEPNECLYSETDEVYKVEFQKTRSGRFMQLASSSSETTEIWILDLENQSIGIQLVVKRRSGVFASLDHQGDYLYIVTNEDDAKNSKIMRASIGMNDWSDVFPYDEKIKIDKVECFNDFLVLSGRQDGLPQLWIVKESRGELPKYPINFEEPVYGLVGSENRDFSTRKYRLVYSSMTTPRRTYDFDVDRDSLVFLRETKCPNYDRTLYRTERLEATASDGTKVPISIAYKTDLRTKNPQPLHLWGYGSYEASIDWMFTPNILPLLDRGVIFAVAHVRGGGEMGRTWYESAKYKTKINTFTDFIACAEHLVASRITTSSMMTCEGQSAGGLLVGAVLNMRPDLFTAAFAGVPFVDVMNTMSDATIPLTTGEWEEWGNPNEAEFFMYMLSYSPYNNVRAQKYPNILVTSGLNDPRVAYWEPTKWVARLRELKTDDNDILLRVNMSSGHRSASDRYEYLRERAHDLAFLLDKLIVS